ncbi:hypothetical protein FC85_GL000287 [Lentilactobacillus diolivorans DSM 14421]|uniref:Uncharacterized protein n=1 Tax=Lentilactobacillus diolivorans DSM 14421 TaxID=1423739 RepID=A0A0R1SGC6_9LACO|nr:hypothetical protein FC85_GL000287 [Lentilactobacillus diolivorans DSM 14421]
MPNSGKSSVALGLALPKRVSKSKSRPYKRLNPKCQIRANPRLHLVWRCQNVFQKANPGHISGLTPNAKFGHLGLSRLYSGI